MKKLIKNSILVGLVIVSAGVVKATEDYYPSTVQVGYPYKLVGQYRDFGAGEQRIELNKAYPASETRQTIEVEYQQKNALWSSSLGSQQVEIIYKDFTVFSKTLNFGSQKYSGKRRYIFYNNLSNQNNTAVFIDDVRMYPKT